MSASGRRVQVAVGRLLAANCPIRFRRPAVDQRRREWATFDSGTPMVSLRYRELHRALPGHHRPVIYLALNFRKADVPVGSPASTDPPMPLPICASQTLAYAGSS